MRRICCIPCQCPSPVSTPSFGNFFTNDFQTLNQNDPMPWNGIGGTSGGLFLDANSVDIHVTQAGFYSVDYIVSAFIDVPTPSVVLGIFINGVEVPNQQTRFGTSNFDPDRAECATIAGGSIISIPANSTVQLRSIFGTFTTCDGPLLAASIKFVKVSA
jgi:hypothetical protein